MIITKRYEYVYCTSIFLSISLYIFIYIYIYIYEEREIYLYIYIYIYIYIYMFPLLSNERCRGWGQDECNRGPREGMATDKIRVEQIRVRAQASLPFSFLNQLMSECIALCLSSLLQPSGLLVGLEALVPPRGFGTWTYFFGMDCKGWRAPPLERIELSLTQLVQRPLCSPSLCPVPTCVHSDLHQGVTEVLLPGIDARLAPSRSLHTIGTQACKQDLPTDLPAGGGAAVPDEVRPSAVKPGSRAGHKGNMDLNVNASGSCNGTTTIDATGGDTSDDWQCHQRRNRIVPHLRQSRARHARRVRCTWSTGAVDGFSAA